MTEIVEKIARAICKATGEPCCQTHGHVACRSGRFEKYAEVSLRLAAEHFAGMAEEYGRELKQAAMEGQGATAPLIGLQSITAKNIAQAIRSSVET